MSQETIGEPIFASTRDSTRTSGAKKNGLLRLTLYVGVALLSVTAVTQALQPHFTVAPGDNLVDKMGYDRAIKFADKVGLPIYLEMNGEKKQIPLDAAQTVRAPLSDYVRVSVPVYDGDKVDTRFFRSSFTPAPAVPVHLR